MDDLGAGRLRMGGELGNGAIKSRSKARQAASSEKGARQEIPPWAAGLRPPLSDGVQLHPASMGTKPTTGPTSLWGQESPCLLYTSDAADERK